MTSTSKCINPEYETMQVDDDKHDEHVEKLNKSKSTPLDPNGLEAQDPPKSTSSKFQDARDLVTAILSLDDDPTLNPWTFRMWFIGLGLSVFAGTVTTINTFKPQAVRIHIVFIVVITYVFGTLLSNLISRKGAIGRFLNPGPFNRKEHAACCIMISASAATPQSMLVLAVQKLYYNFNPSPIIGILLILSTQMLGYGIAGVLRKTLVYPSTMLYPTNLPTAALLESLHLKEKAAIKNKLRIFRIAFGVLFIWQIFPQYIIPLFAGISVFCLSMQHSSLVSHLFGGSMANEGLGFLSISTDWAMISADGNPLYLPLITLCNTMAGWLIGVLLLMCGYYGNIWDAKSLPFMSTTMFSSRSTVKNYIQYNQTRILDQYHKVVDSKLRVEGLPYISTSYAVALTLQNISIMAAITHMCLWHWKDLKSTLGIFTTLKKIFQPRLWNLRFWKHSPPKISREEADEICPHYGVMQAYKDVPSSWFVMIWVISAIFGLVSMRQAQSGLEIWAFFIAVFLAVILITPFAALTAMFGFFIMVQPLMQMIGAYILPGRPLANLYFSTFANNSLYMAKHMMGDLKLGQYVHLAPRCTFTVQLVGTTIGCIMSYVMMEKITTERRDILLSIQGSNVWAGNLVQSVNLASVTWGGLAKQMYGIGSRYQPVTLGFIIGLFAPVPFWAIHKFVPGGEYARLNLINLAMICGFIQTLSHGANSGNLLHFIVGFTSQFYLRKYRTNWFIKYNYILSAGLDGGTQVINFILTFTVFGAAGRVHDFPKYFGNNWQKGNYDYCKRDEGLHAKKKAGLSG